MKNKLLNCVGYCTSVGSGSDRCMGLFLVHLWAVTHVYKCSLVVLMIYMLQHID
jgi:hypothetical protein